MTFDKIAAEVPFGWYERQTRNPWFNRETGKVEMPIAIKDRRNIVLTLEELTAYTTALQQLEIVVHAQYEKVLAARNAMEKGRVPAWINHEPKLILLNHALEFMVTLAKHKLGVTQLLVKLTGRAKEAYVLGSTNAKPEFSTEALGESILKERADFNLGIAKADYPYPTPAHDLVRDIEDKLGKKDVTGREAE